MKNIIKTLFATSFIIFSLSGCLQLNIAQEGMFKNTSGLKKFLEKGEDVNFQDDDGATALINAAYWGNLKAVELLLEYNADVHIKDNDGESAILATAGTENNDDDKIIQLLVAKGANIDDQNLEGDTALHSALIFTQLKTVTALLKNGANPNIKNNDGDTPAFFNCEADKKNREALALLLNNGADPTIKDNNDRTILHCAVSDTNPTTSKELDNIIKLFIQKGGNINEQDNEGDTALHDITLLGDIKTVKLLLDSKANPNIKNDNGETPIFHACYATENNLDLLNIFINRGANINEKNNYGESLLHNAVAYADIQTIQALLEKGLPVNDKTKHGYTPIWNVCEAEENNREIVDLLLSHGANINAKDVEGDTLSAIQSCLDKPELLDYMVSKGLRY